MEVRHRKIFEECLRNLENGADKNVSTFPGLDMTGIKVGDLKTHMLKYKIFTTDMLADIKSEIDLFRELPTRGPHAFKKFIHILKQFEIYEGQAIALENREREWGVFPKKTFYKMSSRPLGFCLLINNEDFPLPERRHGSENDVISLTQIFSRMNFDIEVERNFTASQMLERLKEFAKKDFSEVDCSVVIISSHGAHVNNLDVVLGVDGKYFYKHVIYEMFNYDICKTLRKKPKIFIYQCCREEDAKVANGLIGESSDSVKIDEKDPKWSDMYIAHSCLPDEESVRDHQDGTWFCQDLIEVFSEHYLESHLDEMIQMTNIKLMQRTSYLKTKQAIHAETFGLRGPIYFN